MRITALVLDSLDCDILAGVPFCKQNGIDINLQDEIISFDTHHINYGAEPKLLESHIHRSVSIPLRNDMERVIMP